MPTTSPANPRVAVYLDFDNVVISRYDQVHSATRDAWRSDNARTRTGDLSSDDPVDARLAEAQVDVGAVLDYASSYGRVALARAYADWSVPANAAYRRQLVDRAVDLTQLFPVSGTKNGADIRLSVDAMEDLMQYPDLTHVVLVAGDSDYIALAQRCKQLGRYVIGIGVSGSTSRALIAACDEFSDYDALPGVRAVTARGAATAATSASAAAATSTAADDGTGAAPPRRRRSAKASAAAEPDPAPAKKRSTKKSASAASKRAKTTEKQEPSAEQVEAERQQEATQLLVRALQVAQDRADEEEWLFGGGVKSQMQRMDAGFKEKALGYKTFTAFVESRADAVESRIDPSDGHLRLRLR